MKKILLFITLACCAAGAQAQTRYLTVSQDPSLLPLGVNAIATGLAMPSCAPGPATTLYAVPSGFTLTLDATTASFLPPGPLDHFTSTNVEVTVGGSPFGAPIFFCPGGNKTNAPISFGGGMYNCFYDITYDPVMDETTIYFHP
ncbi:MAG: hypothetical protein JNL13_06690 [Chitinophagaceae bacterium]|nr:hypothetical protein [Chitinophagaceae bacterium]